VLPVALPHLLSPPPYPFYVVPYGCSPIILSSLASSSRWRYVSAADTTFIVCYCPAVPLLSLHDDVVRGRDGEGRRRVSRDRPRCPVLHCRSPVWRRPTHRRHHVWLETEAGRDRSAPCPSVRTTFALLSTVKSVHGDKYHYATDRTFSAILQLIFMARCC
jgi:hypothetical protein